MNAEALSRCITLAVERIEGGAPPPAKLAADVKRLAKAAGVDFLEAAQPLVASALHAAVIKQAPQAFWNGFRTPIVAWARTSREARDALFALTPDIPTTRWLPLLEATGVADEMRAGERDVLDWIRRFIHKESDRWRQHFPAELSAFIRALPSQHGQTLRLEVARDDVEMELVDAVLSLGLDVAFTGDCDPLGWLSWQFWLVDERRGDLVHVAASEHATHAAAGLDRITLGTHLDALLAHPGSAQLLHRWAAPRVDHGCTAADFLAEVDRLRPLCLPAYRDEFRDELAGLASVADPAELTAQALRDGLLTELTWPALEEAARQLDEVHPDKVTIHESWPWFGVASGNRIIWVTADTSEAPVTVTPPVHSHHDSWQWFRVGGDTLCLSWTPEQGAHMTWASSPNTHHSLPHLLGGDPRRRISFETASGRLPGPGLIRPGDSRLRPRHRELVLQEGDALWCAEYSQAMRTLDPGTGKLGPESLPPRLASLIEDDLREGFTFIRASVEHWMNVVPGTEDSLLGVKDGQHGWVTLRRYPVLRCRGTDGTIWEHEATVWDHWIAPSSRIRRPGGGHWLVTVTGHLTRESCRRLLPASSRHGVDHLLHRLPVAGWHFLRPRDEAVSARMRAMTARDVQPLLDSLPAWTPEEPRQLPATVVRAAQRLLATSDPALTVAVGWTALRTNRAVQRLRQLIEDIPPSETEDETTWTPSLDAVPWAREGPWDQVLTRVTADELRERLASSSGSPLRMATLATLPLLAPELHLVGAARPLASRATIQAAAAAAAVIADSGLVGPDTVLFTVPSPLILLSEPGSVTTTPTGPAINIGICRDDDGTRLQLFLSPGGGVPTEIQGKPATVWRRSSGIDLADLAAAFDVVLSRGGPPWDPAAAERFALGSGWSRPAATVFLAGSPLNKDEKLDWLPRDLRRLLGLTVAEAAAAREFLTGLDPALLASLYSAGAADPMRAIRHGLDVDAMLTRWQQLSQGLVMLPGDVLLSCRRELGPWQTDNLKLLPRPCADLLQLPHWLWLASSLKLDDPLRPWLAERLDDLTQASRAAPLRTSLIGRERGPVRACLGLPSVRDSIPGAELRTGPWTVTRTDDGYDVLWFDPAETADWRHEHERALAVSRADDTDDLQHVANLTAVVSGRFTVIQDWLRTPGDGWPQDPLASAPEILADVQQTLDLPEDSARYWLQLLTLHNPTDTNIHHWNNWKKTQRLKAAEPLIEKGLLVEAKRPRAGRTLFLPGAWIEARSPHLPLETWKAPLYHLENTPKVKPPFEIVLPLIPLPQLFTDAWRRHRDGLAVLPGAGSVVLR